MPPHAREHVPVFVRERHHRVPCALPSPPLPARPGTAAEMAAGRRSRAPRVAKLAAHDPVLPVGCRRRSRRGRVRRGRRPARLARCSEHEGARHRAGRTEAAADAAERNAARGIRSAPRARRISCATRPPPRLHHRARRVARRQRPRRSERSRPAMPSQRARVRSGEPRSGTAGSSRGSAACLRARTRPSAGR